MWEIYGVSRTLVRKVLVVMEEEGIVHLPANRGAYVAIPTRRDAEELIEFIRTWIGHVVSDMVSNPSAMPENAQNRLREHIQAESAAAENLDSEASFRLSLELWVLLSFIHGNRLITHALERYVLRLSMSLTVLQKHQSAYYYTHPNAALVASIFAGDAQSAIEYLHRQLEAIRKSLVPDLQREVDLRGILGAA